MWAGADAGDEVDEEDGKDVTGIDDNDELVAGAVLEVVGVAVLEAKIEAEVDVNVVGVAGVVVVIVKGVIAVVVSGLDKAGEVDPPYIHSDPNGIYPKKLKRAVGF